MPEGGDQAQIRFGTDGWRAVIAEEFTFPNVRRCAAAVTRYLQERGLAERGLVIGYDTRYASDRFAEAVAEVATAAGVRCYLCDRPAPTPAISYQVLRRQAGGAVVITASHNPPEWSGFKYKPEYAGTAPPEVTSRLEALIAEQSETPPRRLPAPEAEAAGLLQQIDPQQEYLERLAQLVDVERLRAAGLRVAVDPMYGAASGWLRRLLEGGATAVTELHSQRNPLFPGLHAPEPIERNLGEMAALLQGGGFDVGLATDGDADRLGAFTEDGRFLNQLQVFALLTYYLLEVRGQRGPIVKSVTTTRMVNRLGELYGVPVYETPVGFKYLGPRMVETDAIIAGEESGGYGFRGHIPERDGLLSGLYFLDFLVRTGRSPSQLLRELSERVGPHYYAREDVRIPPEERQALQARVEDAHPAAVAGLRVAQRDTADGVRFTFEGGGWLLLRFSGTEPLLRVYTEVPAEELARRVIAAGKALAGVP